MIKSKTFFEKCNTSSSLINLAYRDYIAARFLLNNQLILQGLMLASTAVEKYLKAIIVFNLDNDERYNYHFDRFQKLKDLLLKSEFKMINEFDPVFLEVLEKAFKLRYYDGLKDDIEIGIYLNQFIGELDIVVNRLEKYIM
ncbi:HEPN domain-containing protein, partial [Sphingobacterium sp. SGL-16]|uniref:HEPN domain-containing protein n=1 Tax=Sphingobacterium sp. SGL-16 TaxID=2710883 RepID=UPI0013EE2EE3